MLVFAYFQAVAAVGLALPIEAIEQIDFQVLRPLRDPGRTLSGLDRLPCQALLLFALFRFDDALTVGKLRLDDLAQRERLQAQFETVIGDIENDAICLTGG